MTSIKDVAKEAGVSVATVSRVINNKGVCTPDTVEAVMNAVKKLGYKPSFFGKALRSSETNIIMVMLSSLANTFCGRVIHAIDKMASNAGYHVMICTTEGIKAKEDYYTTFACNGLFDGIIILNSSLSKDEMAALSSQIPVVQCNEYIDTENTTYITIDNKVAAYDAVSLLIANGNKKIVFYTVDNDLASSRERLAGYKEALKDNNIVFDEDLVVYGNYGYRNAVTQFESFMYNGKEFDSVFAISDRMAAGVLSVLTSQKVKVPEEVEVIGFDNTDISYTTNPKITTIAPPHYELGSKAFNQLQSLMAGNKPNNIILSHKIILRDSTI